MPTYEQFIDMCHEVMSDQDRKFSNSMSAPKAIEEWQKRMFLAPQPQHSHEISDLIVATRNPDEAQQMSAVDINCRLIEAYRRGKEGHLDAH